MKRIALLFLYIHISSLLFSSGESELINEGTHSFYGTTDIAAGMSFPPYSNSEQIDFTISQLKKMAVDRIRIAIDWRNREPEQGKFYWDPMDYRMNSARDNNISVFLTIGSLCPDWARLTSGNDGACIMDEKALQTFIEEILLRYDYIDKIQFGNEWESGSVESGTAYTDENSIEKFVIYNNILYDAVQRLSPDTRVVLGGLTRTYPIIEYFVQNGSYPNFTGLKLANGASIEYLEKRTDKMKVNYDNKGIKKNIEYVFEHAEYDILDIHLYDDPANWPEYLTVLPHDKPILVSEFGGPNSEFENTSPFYQAEKMTYYIDAIEQLPIIEAYYFKLVESDTSYHRDSGLYYNNLRAKPARNVFARRLKSMY